jgi:general stress protein YciG
MFAARPRSIVGSRVRTYTVCARPVSAHTTAEALPRRQSADIPPFLCLIPTDPAVAPGLHCSDSTVKIEHKGVDVAKEDRGFASMDRMRQREIASKGGKAAHQKGTAHEWTSEEARDAGRKGGLASHRQRRERKDSSDTRELVGAASGFSTGGAE